MPDLDVFNPSTGALFASCEADSLETALGKTEKAFQFFLDTKRHLDLHERVFLLERLVTHMESKRNEFIETMVQEGGKPWNDSVVEFSRAVQGVKLAISCVSEHVGSSIPLGYQASSADRIATTRVFPRGVVLAFSAFNHPLNLIVHQIIPAFATGCPCVVKPAPDTPLSCMKLVEAMHDVGIPEDYVQAVITDDIDIAGELVASDKIAFFSFIGSAKVGWMLRSKLRPGVRCALEHGGVAPCIVSSKADIELAVNAIAKGGFYHAGQVCVSTQRVYVEASILDSFSEQLRDKAKALKVGNSMSESTEVGPLIRSGEITRIHAWIQEATAQGADCLCGGEAIDDHFYKPTVLLNPPKDAKVSQEEIFGPVVCVYGYDSFEEVLTQMNHDRFAFQAAIFSRDICEILQAYDSVEASALMVNDHTAFRDDVMPFAGLNSSGLGVGGIPYTIEEMQYEKMLVLKK